MPDSLANAQDFERFFRYSHDLLAIVDEEGIFRVVNAAWGRALAYAPEELVGRPFLDFVHEEDREATLEQARLVVEGGLTVGFENRWRSRGGAVAHIQWSVVPDLEARRFYAVGWDVSKRRLSEARLLEQEVRLAAVLEAAGDAILLASESGIISSVNPATCELFGYSQEELVGENLSILMPEPDRSLHDGYLRRFLETGEARVMGGGREVTGLHSDGTRMPLYLSLSGARVGGAHVFAGIIRDLREAKAREEEILQAAAARRAAEIQVALAGELHDGLLQILAGSTLQLRAAERLLSTDPASAEVRLRAVREAIAAEQKTIRMFVDSSRSPEALVGEGVELPEVLAQLAARIEGIWGARLDLDVGTEGPERLSGGDRREIVRLVQEAAVNAIRHGGSSLIRARISLEGSRADITISDNGGGFPWEGRFDHERLRSERRGPLSLRRRLEGLGGRLAIESRPDGVVIEMTVPLGGPGSLSSGEIPLLSLPSQSTSDRERRHGPERSDR